MRFATVRADAGTRLHLRGPNGYVDVASALGRPELSSLTAFLREDWRGLGRRLSESLDTAPGVHVAEASLGPAVPQPGRVLCLGINYGEHARETGWAPPSWPETFVRGAQSVTGPYDDVARPALTHQFDFEGELALVIGSRCRYVRAADALDVLLGVTVVNEMTARDWQRASKQWTPGKNFDRTLPIGPEVVTLDELPSLDLGITTRVNGEVMQEGRTSQMLVQVAQAIEFFSSFTTLEPGDVIATGTPSGVGFTRNPPVYLDAGDVVEVAIEGVGTVRNRLVTDVDPPAGWPWTPATVTGSSL